MAKATLADIIKRTLFVGFLAFFLAILISGVTQSILDNIASRFLSFLLLLIIILIGIGLDIIGTAVAAADEGVFHAMATNRIKGSLQAAWMVKNAAKVANFCNDIVGDVSSAICGALGVGIALTLARGNGIKNILMETLMTGLIAGLTVGGKAAGKNFAINEANKVIYFTGALLDKLHINFRQKKKRNNNGKYTGKSK